MSKSYFATIVVCFLITGLVFTNFTRIREVITTKETPIVFSRYELLENIWENYKREYLEPDTFRTIDRQRSDITTSEGQSYTMLRAVWIDDKDTFDSSWQWTKDILQRKEDKLFSWLFGEKGDGNFGILVDEGGRNTATDADIDIAMALIMAANRWGNIQYLNEAKEIITDIWKHTVIEINGKYVLLANSIEKNSQKENLVLNPSYFTPHAYRVFAKIDKQNPWDQLAKDSYPLLLEATSANLDKNKSVNLPPDWIFINRTSGQIGAINQKGLSTNYSYDALRIPWRIALDWLWYENIDAKNYLSKLEFLSNQYNSQNKIYANYAHDGEVLESVETIAMYGASLGYFLIHDKENADKIYNQKILPAYSKIKNEDFNLGYYDDNWIWFGLAMYQNALTDLTAGIENKTN